ncbi:MAG: thermonuclease family protein [Deltaproteobacteria bacterium]|nr:thermonuclease family protein [Deltaproteobacteria bacterium]
MTYPELRRQIQTTLFSAQEQIQRIKVEAYWQAGHHIRQHILEHKERAEYGQEVLQRLAEDTGIHRTALNRLVKFSQAWPQKAISAARHQLGWSHYRALLPLKDPKRVKILTRQAIQLHWTTRELEAKVREARWTSQQKRLEISLLEKPTLGPPYTYKIVGPEKLLAPQGDLFIDLGFTLYLHTTPFETKPLQEGDIVTAHQDTRNHFQLQKALDLTSEELFTYPATVEKVVDGDTLRAQIDLGFGIRIRQYLRLRGINTPELGTPRGDAAHAFVQKELAKGSPILIKTTKPEKYDRYLSDVFYKNGLYLNQRLLDSGHAIPV